MEPVLDISSKDTWPVASDRTPEQNLAVSVYERTAKMPYKYQVEVALALKSGRDVLCIAGTGAGKSMAFVLPLFLGTKTIVWIVSPLNFIENQMAENYSKFGLTAVTVNASTITPGMIADIKKGKYQVVISSPEAYKDANKLHSALLSKELLTWQHITVVDEAHVIHTWANNDFRVVYQRIGDMRVYLPPNSPMCAATATCSPNVKQGILCVLHMSNDFLSIHLGNWRANLSYGLHVMQGGKKSYGEIVDVISAFAPSNKFMDLPQVLIFVKNYPTAYFLAHELQKYYGLSCDETLWQIAIYHSICDELIKNWSQCLFHRGIVRIMICTEALTMLSYESRVAEQERQKKEDAQLEVTRQQQAEKEERNHIKQVQKENKACQRQEAQAAHEAKSLKAKQAKDSQPAQLETGIPSQSAFLGHGLSLPLAPQAWPLHCTSQPSHRLAIGESVMSFSAPVTPAMQPGELDVTFSVPHTPVSTSSTIPSPVSAPLTPLLGLRPVGTLIVGPSGQPIGSSSGSQAPHSGPVLHNQLQLAIPPIPSSGSSTSSLALGYSSSALPSLFATPPQTPAALPEHLIDSASTSSMPTVTTTSTSSGRSQKSNSTSTKQRTRSCPPPKGQFKFAPQYQCPPPAPDQK